MKPLFSETQKTMGGADCGEDQEFGFGHLSREAEGALGYTSLGLGESLGWGWT